MKKWIKKRLERTLMLVSVVKEENVVGCGWGKVFFSGGVMWEVLTYRKGGINGTESNNNCVNKWHIMDILWNILLKLL